MKIQFKKGAYYPEGVRLPGLNFSHRESYTIKFSSSCLYTPTNWENDTNKLAGFTLGLLPVKVVAPASYYYSSPDFGDYWWHHHFNSVRLAWAPEGEVTRNGDNTFIWIPTGKIAVYLYTYEAGIRTTTYLKSVEVNVEITINLAVTQETIQVNIDNERMVRYVHKFSNISTGYSLNPYFGGTDPAANNLDYELQRS